MLSPKKTKYRKAHKGRIRGNAKGGSQLNFGEFGLKAMQPERITARQIEAARRAISRHMKRVGRLWIRIFPDVPVTRKPAEVRKTIARAKTLLNEKPGAVKPKAAKNLDSGAPKAPKAPKAEKTAKAEKAPKAPKAKAPAKKTTKAKKEA